MASRSEARVYTSWVSGSYEIIEGKHLGVDSRPVALSTAQSKTHHPSLDPCPISYGRGPPETGEQKHV